MHIKLSYFAVLVALSLSAQADEQISLALDKVEVTDSRENGVQYKLRDEVVSRSPLPLKIFEKSMPQP